MQYTTVMGKSGPTYRISRLFSLLCLLFSLFLVWGLATSYREGVGLRSMIHIVVLLAISIGGALYRDSWHFDLPLSQITAVWGFGPFVKRNHFRFDEVERLSLTHVDRSGSPTIPRLARRRRPSAMVIFSLAMLDGTERTIQVMGERRSAGRVEEAARMIGAATGLSLYIDRGRDMETDLSLHDL